MLTVSLFISPVLSLRSPTGVSEHTMQMAAALAGRSDVDLSWLAPAESFRLLRPALPAAAQEVAVKSLPDNESLTRRMFLSGLLNIDRWSMPVDWIYCPREQPVTTRRSKLAVTVHDVIAFEPELATERYRRQRLSLLRWRLVMRRLLRRADLVSTVSEFTRQRMMDLFDVAGDRIVVTGNGVDASFFQQDDEVDRSVDAAGYGIERPYLLAVGGLAWRRGGDRLLELADLLTRRGDPIDLVVTGRRHDQDLLKRIEEGRSGRVKLIGYVPREHLPVLLKRAEALVHLSRYEGFGMPVLEAMAAGCPVVCTSAGALPEVAGDTVKYVSGADRDETCGAIEEVRRGDASRAERLSLGRARAREFSWERAAGRLVDAMKRVA